MKKGILACVIAYLVLTNPFSFHLQQDSAYEGTSIIGKISPEEAAETALIIDAKDTLRTPVVWGNFSQQVKPGKYKLIVWANAPFKNVSLGNFEVKQNHVLDIGELILQQ